MDDAVFLALFPQDHETSNLLKEATQWRDKDWTRAIECLRLANERMKTSPVSYPILSWLRLPLYLQHAGRYEESMVEFMNIWNETPERIARAFAHQPVDIQLELALHDLEIIREKMELAQARECD